jgi:hypothetical protein
LPPQPAFFFMGANALPRHGQFQGRERGVRVARARPVPQRAPDRALGRQGPAFAETRLRGFAAAERILQPSLRFGEKGRFTLERGIGQARMQGDSPRPRDVRCYVVHDFAETAHGVLLRVNGWNVARTTANFKLCSLNVLYLATGLARSASLEPFLRPADAPASRSISARCRRGSIGRETIEDAALFAACHRRSVDADALPHSGDAAWAPLHEEALALIESAR